MLNRQFFWALRNGIPRVASTIRGFQHSASGMQLRRSRRDEKCETPVAIILSGCGYLDGTEISEAMSATFHVCKRGMTPTFYAPDIDICQVVDHFTKEIDNQAIRNSLSESARIARSKVKPLCECEACRHAGLIIPGGMGAAKILSNYADKGACCSVIPELEKVIEDFSCERKPIGAMCIGSVLVARVLKGVKVTLGKTSPQDDWPYSDAISKCQEMGAKVEMKDVKGVTRCKTHNVFSTPAWLYQRAAYRDIHTATGKMIKMMKKCMSK